MAEGTLRNWINKYEPSISGNVYDHELIAAYNQYVQKQILPTLNIQPNIHILDCTKVKVQLNNKNYVQKDRITSIIVYAGTYFGRFDLLEFMDIYASCNEEIKKRLHPILAKT